jgi:hypothetical protein
MKLVRALLLLLTVSLLPGLRADRTELLWQKLPGDYLWLGGAGSNTERGIAYNPITKHVLVVHRNSGDAVLGVYIVDAETGDEIPSEADPLLAKTLDLTDVAGGAGGFPLNMIGVADDGVIYAANLTTGSLTTNYKIYRWADENALPTVAYEGNPGDTNNMRFGDTFDVRGAGPNTQIMTGARNSAHVAIFTTTDGTNFVSTLIPGAGNASGNVGVAFGAGNTGYSKLSGSPLRHFSFDLTAKTSALLESIATSPGTFGPIGGDSVGKYLGLAIVPNATTAATARVVDISAGGAILVGEQSFGAAANPNGNGVGGVDIGDNKAFFVAPNNGILALRIVQEITPVSIATHPANTTVIESGRVTLSVVAAGTPPLTYEWTHAGTNLPGATSSSLLLTNVTSNADGEYQVTVRNGAGPVTSNPATLTVAPIVRGPKLTLKWKILAGERDWFGDDINTRGIAINKVTGNVLVVRHVLTTTTEVHVLDGNTGVEKHMLNVDPAIVTGGTFFLNMIGVADDGAVYAANLTTDAAATPFTVYRWPSDAADAVPEIVYTGNPNQGFGTTRFGDSFDVRGSGSTTQILVAARDGGTACIIYPANNPPDFRSTVIDVAEIPSTTITLNIAFGEGDSYYRTANGTPIRFVTYDDPRPTFLVQGTVAREYSGSEIPLGVTALGYDVASKALAGITLETPDTVRLYKIPNDITAAPTLVDQELFDIDNANGNGTGSADFALGKLAVIDTQNWIAVFDYNPADIPIEFSVSIVNIAANGEVTIRVTGVPQQYKVEATNSLNAPVSWSTVGTVTTDASGSATIVDTAASGQATRFYRVTF